MRRLDRSVKPIPAAVLELLGKLHDQNGVFCRKTDQHDETNLGENVVVLTTQNDANDRRDETHRHDHDHRQWQGQAFKLRREHQKYEDHCQHEGEGGGTAGADLLVSERCPLIGKSLRTFPQPAAP